MAWSLVRQFVQCQEDKVSRDNMSHPATIWHLTFEVISYIIGDMLKTQKQKEERKEQPLLNLKVEVDSWRYGYHERLNWELMSFIDLEDVFRTILPEEKGKYKNDQVPYTIADARAKRFMERLKAYIIEKTEDDDEDFDWSEWHTYRG